MELKVNREELTNALQVYDIVFAVIEANDENLLLEMMNNVKEDYSKNLQNDIFLNASVELKNKLKNFVGLEIVEKYDLNAKPQYTYAFTKRKYNAKEPVVLKLDGNTFLNLQQAILNTRDANTILDFARNYKVDNSMFLKKLAKLGKMYEKAYRREVMNDYRYQKDDLQLYM